MLPQQDFALLEDYLNGVLPPEQAVTVEARLKSDALFAEALVRLAREESILKDWAGTTSVVQTTEAALAPLPKLRPARQAFGWRRYALVAASILLVTILLARPRNVETPDQALAQLQDIQGEVYVLTDDGEIEAQPGQMLFAGQGVSTSGEKSSAVVQYADATRLELAGDTRVHFMAGVRGKKIEVATGAGDVSGMTADNRMTLSTPHVDVQAQGSKFSFTSFPEGGTRVESEKGRVKVTRKSDGKSVTVDSGQYAVASRRPDPMRALVVPSPRLTLEEGSGPVQSLFFSSDGQKLYGGGGKGQIRSWNTVTGQAEHVFEKPGKRVNALCLSADGITLAAAGDDRTIFLWNLATGRERQVGSSLRTKVLALAFSPDGRWLVAGCEDRMVRFLDLVSGEEQVVLKGHKGRIVALTFSHDGRFIVSVGGVEKQSGEVLLWDALRQQLIGVLEGHDRDVLAAAFSPDSKILATGGRDNTVRLWDPATGKTIRILRGHAGAISSLAFAPDGKTLASGACDGLVKLWDVATGLEHLSFKGHKNCIGALCFSPDGKTLATGGRDKVIKFWNLSQLEAATPVHVSRLREPGNEVKSQVFL